MNVERLGSKRTPDAVDILCDAFRDYPAMRYFICQHAGYEVVGHEQVSDDLETWILFRPNDEVR